MHGASAAPQAIAGFMLCIAGIRRAEYFKRSTASEAVHFREQSLFHRQECLGRTLSPCHGLSECAGLGYFHRLHEAFNLKPEPAQRQQNTLCLQADDFPSQHCCELFLSVSKRYTTALLYVCCCCVGPRMSQNFRKMQLAFTLRLPQAPAQTKRVEDRYSMPNA